MNLEEYFSAVSSIVNEHVEQGVNDLKSELSKIATSRSLHQVTPAKLNEACDRLLQKTKFNFDKNLAKFQIYTIRNVFRNEASSSSPVKKSESTSSAAATTAGDEAETHQLNETLENMRQEFINMHQEWSKITAECQDMDALIKDMRATSFSVRLSIQEMDQQFDSQSLADTTTAVSEQRNRLMELCKEAEEYLRRLEGTQQVENGKETADGMYFTGDTAALSTNHDNAAPSTNQDNVRAGSASSINKIANSLQRK